MRAERGTGLRLVCLPGTLCTGKVFEPMVSALTADRTNVTADCVDYGSARSVAEAATAVERHCATVNEAVILVGFSLGAIVAVQAALLLQPRLAALILIDMNGQADKSENATIRRAAVMRARSTSIRTFVDETIWPTHIAPSRQDDASLREAVVAMAEACGLERFANQVEIAITRPRALDRMAELHLPALVVCGDLDSITPVALSREITSALPRGDLRLVTGAGHFTLLEKPAVVAAVIGQWLDSPALEERLTA